MSEIFVVGVDGSDGSRRALHAAARAAERLGARLLVAHVVAEVPGVDRSPLAPETAFGQQEHEVEEAHAHMLEAMVGEIGDLGVRVELATLHGDPATELADLAAGRDAAQIFIGCDQHSRLHERLFGSTVTELARKTTVPLTLIP